MRTPVVTNDGAPRANGTAAFDAWTAALLKDEEFTTGMQKSSTYNAVFQVLQSFHEPVEASATENDNVP
jgi:hypothetical protein